MTEGIDGRKKQDVVVVGGSAAGLFTAYLLAKEGVRVRLFDANVVTRASSRTLIATSHLNDVLGFSPSEAVVNHIHLIELFSPRRSATIRIEKPDLVVERTSIVKLLAQKAVQHGAEIRSHCKVVEVTPANNGVTVKFREHGRGVERVQATTLIGADGVSSRVARIAGENGVETVPILQAIVSLPPGVPANAARVWFQPEETPYFYWMIPESTRRAAVGFIAQDGTKNQEKLYRFLRRQRLKPHDIQAARIPLYARTSWFRKKVSGCSIYLVGDAAAQVKVTTVGGLVTGLRGAKAVAQEILGHAQYKKEMRSLRRELRLHTHIRAILNSFDAEDYDSLLTMLNNKTVRLLELRSRDEFASAVFRLLAAQPRFLALTTYWLRSLWKRRPPLQ
ncbi:MAG: NAD(P)/FAD-dependent oxidoreductase [Deltaproteobacteria bacterium]|nr:NAD(P)/FAD-dependent oxidoreductase [Deltaproteobacteria bacterium]